MKSKISFINRTMLQKNVKLYWPIWTLYTIVLLLNGPFSMWSRFKNAEFIYGKNWHKYMLDIISPAISMEADMIFIFVMALVTGMAMFSYLYNSRACNMIHSMPVTRRQLFSTNVLTGLLFMWIPQIIKYFMSFVICISYGNTKVVHIGINLLAAMGISFFMYSLVCLCAMITGQLVSVAVMYAVVNLLYGGAVIAIANVLTYVSYGLPYMEFVRKISVTWFAPMLQLLNRVGFHPTMKKAGDDYYCIKYTFRGTNTIVVYVIAAAVIYFISYKIYKHRDLENAGSFIAIPKLKPVFRWVLGCFGGLILSTVTASLLLGLRISIGVPAIMMLAVVLGIIAFLLLEMIIKKNFKIFSKALFKEIIAFGAFVVVVFGGITVYGNVQENYIPKLADIDSACIAIDFDINLEGKDVEKILETQKILMAQKKDYFKKRYDDSGYITISYTLKNGEKVNRVYHTTDDFNPHKQCKAIMAEENKPQNIINAIMQCDTTDITFINGSAEQYNDKYVDVLNERFNGKVAADIFDAVKKDVDAGVMQEYNLQRMLDGVDKDTSYMYNLMLNFTVPKGNRVGKSWNVDGFTWYEELLDILGVTKEYSDFGDARSDGIETYSVNIRFGENCTNLIAVLKENGLISSKEPLLTYE